MDTPEFQPNLEGFNENRSSKQKDLLISINQLFGTAVTWGNLPPETPASYPGTDRWVLSSHGQFVWPGGLEAPGATYQGPGKPLRERVRTQDRTVIGQMVPQRVEFSGPEICNRQGTWTWTTQRCNLWWNGLSKAHLQKWFPVSKRHSCGSIQGSLQV